MIKDNVVEIIDPKDQLCLFGYDTYFKSFIKLFEKKVMPHCVLLSGPNGLGKSTFIESFGSYLVGKGYKLFYLKRKK